LERHHADESQQILSECGHNRENLFSTVVRHRHGT
jgi:hypothetical protein